MESTQSTIEYTLNALIRDSELFLSVLDIEKNAINSRDADALLKITEYKKELISNISQSDKTLNIIHQSKQLKNAITLGEFIEIYCSDIALGKWNTVKNTIRQCINSNKQNEFLLANCINHVSQALNLLITTATGEPCSTYSKSGHTSTLNSDHVLAKA